MKLARLLRVWLGLQLTLGWLAGYAAGDALASAAARWLLALGAAAALPVSLTAMLLGAEVVIGAATDPAVRRRGLGSALRVWLQETWASIRAFCFRQPFRAGFPEPAVAGDPGRPAVLLVHGYVCNRAVWHPMLNAGVLDGCNAATVDLEPVYGSVDDYATPIHAAVERLRAASGAASVILVAHSMGGLAVRAYLRRYGDSAVARVVTIGTPHAGTLFAWLGSGTNARQMRPHGEWLRALDDALTPPLRRRFVCVAGSDDNLILPRASALLAGARHRLLDGVGHLAALEDARVWAIIREEALATVPEPGGHGRAQSRPSASVDAAGAAVCADVDGRDCARP